MARYFKDANMKYRGPALNTLAGNAALNLQDV